MATSGSWNYTLDAAGVIEMAVENLGVLAAGGTIVTADQTMALRRLNVIAKQYQGKADGSPGIKVHTRQRVTLMLAKGQQTYLVGPASTDANASTQLGRTTLSADEAAGQTVLSITSNTDTTTYPGTTITMTDADIIGIQLNDGTIQWTVISGTPGATATVAVALTSAASSGNYVYWYTSRAQRFPVLEAAVLREAAYTSSELSVYTEVRQYELGVSAKYTAGTPTALLCEPLLTSTRITLDSQPSNVAQQIVLTVLYPSEDYDSTANDIAFPQEGYRFLAWELTFEIAPAFKVAWTPDLELRRKEARAAWSTLNPENSIMFFQQDGD